MDPADAAPKAILVLGGSFNPVHLQHVHLLYAARRHLETAHSPRLRVVAGYCAVSSHNYVAVKMARVAAAADDDGDEGKHPTVMRFPHRAQLVRMALASPPPEWYHARSEDAATDNESYNHDGADGGGASTDAATGWLVRPPGAEVALKEPFVSPMELGARLQGAWLAERAVEVVVVVVWGSDRVDPDSGYWRSADPLGFVHLVVGRDGQMARLREKRRADAAVGGGGGAAGGRRSRWEAAVLCELGGKGDGVGDMSSTRLRAMLAAVHVADGRAAKEAAGDAIVRAGFMTAEQLRYVLEHEDDLYYVARPPAARTQATAVGSNAGSRGFGSGSVVGGGADDYDDPRSFFRDRRGGRNGREMLARRAAAAAVAVAVFAAVAAWAFSRG